MQTAAIDVIAFILAGLAAVAAGQAVLQIRERQKEKARLKESLGEEYDEYIRNRKGKK